MAQMIGRYEVKSEIGRGGMSTVFHAYDPRFKRDVAIKVLPREFLHDPLFRARFEREAETIAALEHPAIVPVYDFGEDDGQLFLVMRYMGGGSLSDRLEKGSLPLPRTVDILERLAPALDKAHALGVVHRDLKSANILFDEDDNGFLSDFGIAKLTETSFGLTGTGSMIGTPAYMSPEQARGDPGVDGRSDLYSLGVILFEMLTGQLPFEADTPMGIAIKHITDPVPRVLHFAPDLPPRCEAVILKAMHKSPDDRFPTAEAMVRDLRFAVMGDMAGHSTQSGLAQRPPDTKEMPAVAGASGGGIPVWGWIVGGLVALAVVGGLVFGGGNAPWVATQPTATNTAEAVAETTEAPIAATDAPTETEAPPTITPTPTETAGPTLTPTATIPSPTPSATALPGNANLGGGSGKMIFVSGAENRGNLYVTALTCIDSESLCSTGLLQLTNDAADNRGPIFSPDGTRIAYRSGVSGNRDIYVMNADGTGVQALTTDPENDYSPAWSPDGTKLLFVSERDVKSEIYIMDADGGNQTRLTTNDFDDFYPSWSPDGEQIVFYSRRDNNTDIYLVDGDCYLRPDGCNSGQIRLTTDPGFDYEPSWTPDGNQIVFVSERDGNPEIYIMNADGTNQLRLTFNDAADTTPSVSPDGKLIAFVAKRGDTSQIYIINLTGEFERQLTMIEGVNSDPGWQPPE